MKQLFVKLIDRLAFPAIAMVAELWEWSVRNIWLLIGFGWMAWGDTSMALFMFFLAVYFKLDDIHKETQHG